MIFFVGVLTTITMKLKTRNASVDKLTFCQADNLPEVLLVLIDGSDRLDSVQSERAIALMQRQISTVPKRGRVDVFVIASPGQELARPVFSRCNPGAAGSALVSNAKEDAKNFAVEFTGALEAALEEALEQKPADTSPIMESVRESATRTFSRVPDATTKRMVLVSDMLQNSAISSHYSGLEDFDQMMKSGRWSQAITDLKGAEVTLGYVTRPDSRSIQGLAHQSWWETYFRNVGGRLVNVESF